MPSTSESVDNLPKASPVTCTAVFRKDYVKRVPRETKGIRKRAWKRIVVLSGREIRSIGKG